MVGGHDDEGVAQVDLLEGGGDGLVKVVGLADLAAGVGVVVLLVDGSAFDLQEEALLGLRVGLEQVERLVGEVGEGRALIAEPLGVGGAHGRVLVLGGVLLGGHRRVELGRQVAVAEQGEHRLAILVGQVLEAVDVTALDGLETAVSGLLPQGVAVLVELVEVLGAAADGHVGARVEQLLGDGADATVGLELVGEAPADAGELGVFDIDLAVAVLVGAVPLALRAVAGALGGVGFLDRRSGILDLGGGRVAGGEAVGLGELNEAELRVALDVHGHGVVVGLGAGRPAGAGGGGVGDRGDHAGGLGTGELALGILGHQRIVGAAAQRERGVLADAAFGGLAGRGLECARLADLVEALERAVDAVQVVACDSDLGISHAVADEQDDVLRLRVADRGDALGPAVHRQGVHALAVQIVGAARGERRSGQRAQGRS